MTRSRSGVRHGKQQPRVLLRPGFDSEADARDAVDLIAACGQELDPFQVILTCITLATISGRLAASEVGGLVARQNGKGGWLEAVAIWSLFEPYLYGKLEGRKNTTLWTAHELKTSDDAYARVKALIQGNEDLAAEVVIWNGGLTGMHIIELRDGSRLVFLARSKSSGRGLSPRRVIFDEAQEFSALAFRAMMYATSAQGSRRQLIYAGTVPSPENDSAIWTSVRDRGRVEKPKRGNRLAWAEWTPEGSDNPLTCPDPEDWKARAEANPALGARILAETIDEEWDAAQADIEGFLRERMSVWPSGDAAASIFPTWPTLLGEREEPAAYAIAADVAVSRFALAGATGGFVDLITPKAFEASGPQIPASSRDLFVSEVARIVGSAAVALQEKGPAWTLRDDLEAAGVRVEVAKMDDFVQACADFEAAVMSATIHHGAQPELLRAVAAATWRMVGDRRVISRKGHDIPELEAAILARWTVENGSSVYESREMVIL